ncbi:B3 domain-containing protein [Striga asiatica]|uniref:B3 domain-containing protein n=1 Tax=Striga asiatica TaxID=4170 RepID=A0A5A7Q7J7_STRAF|nr:B3 domain-containing protein [Striga asiatica]
MVLGVIALIGWGSTSINTFCAILFKCSVMTDEWTRFFKIILETQISSLTFEGREYEGTLKMVDNQPTLVEGWDAYIQAEYIEIHYILFFKRINNFHFKIMVTDKTGCERTPVYKVDVIHGNGKRLLQNGGVRQFAIDSGILVGSSCMFTHVGPLNPDKVIKFRLPSYLPHVQDFLMIAAITHTELRIPSVLIDVVVDFFDRENA